MKKLLIILFALLPLVALGVFYYKYYNQEELISIQCGFYHLTGLYCPGCGGQRAFHYLLHGEVLNAIRSNVLFVVGLPFLLYVYYSLVQIHALKNLRYSDKLIFSSTSAYILLFLLAIFFIVRNIPAEPFIYLSPPA